MERRFSFIPITDQFPYDSPIRYLPLAYLLPCDVLSRYPTLRRLPRSLGALNASPEWRRILLSQQFPSEIMDAVASMVFPHLGFGGWKEHYTANSPAWRLSYALPLWAKGVERVWGWVNEAEINVVWVNISNLRKKLKSIGSHVTLQANRGLGYVLEESV